MQIINFNKGWTFEKNEKDSQLKAFQGIQTSVPVSIPYDAMIREERDRNCPSGAQSGFYPGGKYIYEKKFEAPEEWKGKDIFLEFEGIYGNTRIWVNGSYVTNNRNGYVGFCIFLNPWLNYGEENTVRAEVDNSCQPNSRWYTGSGIYRDVNLLIGDHTYVPRDGLRITTQSLNEKVAVVEIEALIVNNERSSKNVECSIQISAAGKVESCEKQEVISQYEKYEKLIVRMPIMNPVPWSPENPQLYECRIQLFVDEKKCDETVVRFGIRTLSLDPVNGLQINGESVDLRGACIHHDNGIIGAETFREAEMYRCRNLKNAGFNAIRSSHHPMSRQMLEVCDEIGMLVMDELTDVWNRSKNAYDNANDFAEESDEWLSAMVAKDYNHPSVIIYSVGNEIQEAGTKQGSWINRHLCNKIHELDKTRYTTNALNGLNCAGKRLKTIMQDVIARHGMENGGGSGGGSNMLNSFMSLMTGERGEMFAQHPLTSEALNESSQSCDITGLNYLSGRYLLEKELHPNKTVLGTETYPAQIEELWKLTKENSHIIGDFTWAGYDYLGEAGCGIFHYDGNTNFTSIYPERLAYIGDIDLIGNRRPISYFREAVYGLTRKPYIAVDRLNHTGETPTKTAWMFKDNISSWTWKGYEGVPASVDVYSSAEEVELFLNGESLGKLPAGKEHHFTANYRVPYVSGILRAVSYERGNIVGEYQIETAADVKKLFVERVTEQEEDLVYLKVCLQDEQSKINMEEKRKVAVSIMGNGVLEGLGTANPSSEENYYDAVVTTYDGFAMAAVRRNGKSSDGPIVVSFSADGCETVNVEI